MRARREVPIQAALLLGGLLVVLPFAWVVSAGFRTQISLLMGDAWFTPTLAAFEEVLFSRTSTFLHNARNSVVVGLASTVHNQRRELVLEGMMRFIIRKRPATPG